MVSVVGVNAFLRVGNGWGLGVELGIEAIEAVEPVEARYICFRLSELEPWSQHISLQCLFLPSRLWAFCYLNMSCRQHLALKRVARL